MIVHCCHCTSCQLETGTAFAINAIIETTAVSQLPSAKPMVPCGPNGQPAASSALPELTTPFILDPQPNTTSSDNNLPLPYQPITRTEAGDAPPVKYVTLPSSSHKGHTAALCPRCGTCVWTHYAGMGPYGAFVRVGTLDEPWRVDPDVHIFTRTKRAFVELKTYDGKVPVFEEFYPDRKAFWRPESTERFDKLVPAIKEYRAVLEKAKM
jgi:hypothetical protein